MSVSRMLKLSSKQIKAIRNASKCDYLSESDREVLTKILECILLVRSDNVFTKYDPHYKSDC